jgi:hypothetical protein
MFYGDFGRMGSRRLTIHSSQRLLVVLPRGSRENVLNLDPDEKALTRLVLWILGKYIVGEDPDGWEEWETDHAELMQAPRSTVLSLE